MYDGLALPTPARYQVVNAGLAVTAAELLLGALDLAKVRAALRDVLVPGRLQVVSRDPLLLADGAHNPDGVRALVGTLAGLALARPVVAVLAVMRDKDAEGMLRALVPWVDAVVCTQAREPRSLAAAELAEQATALLGVARAGDGAGERPPDPRAVHAVADPHDAAARARAVAGAGGTVLITGSLYLLEDLQDLLGAAEGV